VQISQGQTSQEANETEGERARGESSKAKGQISQGVNEPKGEQARGRTSQEARRRGRKSQKAKKPGGETAKGRKSHTPLCKQNLQLFSCEALRCVECRYTTTHTLKLLLTFKTLRSDMLKR